MKKTPLVMVGLEVTLKPQFPLAVYETIRRLDNRFASLAARIFDFMLRRCAQFGFELPNGKHQARGGCYPNLRGQDSPE